MDGNTDYLQHCFFIYDDFHQDEAIGDEEIVLFFHPNSVDLKRRVLLLGVCESMIQFATQFTKSPARVIELKKFKFTFRVQRPYTIILTAPSDCSRQSLVAQLDLLLDAFQFHYKSIDAVRASCEQNRKAFQQAVARACGTLVPLLSSFHSSLLQQFHPMPYTDLHRFQTPKSSRTTTRYFVAASSLLTKLEMCDKVLAGCVVYSSDYSVLCTHLDLSITRFIAAKLASYECKHDIALNERMTYEVYAQPHVLERMHREIKNTDPPNFKEKLTSEGLVPVTLCVWKHSLLLVAVLVYDHYDETIAEKWNQVLPSVSALDRALKAALIDSPLVYDSVDMERLTHSASPLRLSQSPLRASSTGSPSQRVSLSQSSPNLRVTRQSRQSSSDALRLSSSANNTSQPVFNMLCYEDLTQTQTAIFGLKKNPELERSFLRTIGLAHDQFASDPKVTKIVYRDHQSTIYCRRLFGKETYFQILNSTSFRNTEDVARDTLASTEKNVTLI